MEMHSGIDAVECQELMRNSLAFSGCQKKISRSIYLSTYIFLSDICVPFFFFVPFVVCQDVVEEVLGWMDG